MIGFFIAAVVLLVTVLALVLYPLIRQRDPAAEDRRGDVVTLSRARLEELKERKDSGEITDAEYEEQVRDLETQLADDLHSQSPSSAAAERGSGRWLTLTVLVFIPVMSGLLYLTLGQPRALFPGAETAAATASSPHNVTPADVEGMVAQLDARLQKNPNDADGWFMLGRSYMVLKRYQKAADAFHKLRELVGDEPEVLVREATALAMVKGGDLSGEPTRLVKRALDKQPNDAQALWMAATAAYQAQDYKTALTYYQRVEPLLDGKPLDQVKNMLQDLAAKGYGKGPATGSGTATASSGQSSAPVPASNAANAKGTSLKVSVDLAPSLKDKAEAQASVFIFAKAVSGPPMPLAVVRKTVADLPITVTLDDSEAMMPQLRLSGFPQVTVGARISSSGQPIAQPGDLEGQTGPISTGKSQDVKVTIDHVVPGGG
ncbi:MAG: c-type cytochrome biogenesis protein CcmI [Arenicellales bacterium]